MSGKDFSPREVAVLVEDLKSEFRVVAEGLVGVSDRVESLEDRMSVLETEVRTLSDVIRTDFPSMNRRITALESPKR